MVDELERLRKENREQAQEISLLKQKIDLLVRQIYGSKSERLDPGQLELLLGKEPEEEFEPKKAEAPATPSEQSEGEAAGARESKPRRLRLPEDLPVIEEIIEPEVVKGCREAWRCIGEEVSELLDYEPGRFIVRRTIGRKYVHRTDKEAAPLIAKLPEKLIEGGLPAPGLMAHIIISKYADHLPLFRQEQIYRVRHRVELPRQTLSRWVEAGAQWCAPIYREMIRELKGSGYLQVDETPVRYLEPGAGKAQQGYLWCYSSPGGDVVFDWQAGRGHGCLIDMLGEDRCLEPAFEGVIQCDGYGAYPAYADKNSRVILAACWAHVRRKFYEAKEEAPELCGRALEAIGKLYRIEKNLREARAGPEQRAKTRAAQSRAIIDELHELLNHHRSCHLPRGGTGKAIAYALGQWPRLVRYVDDGRVEIDNNLCENAIRPTAIGKKNWLFIGAEGAGWKSAVLYSILESCRRRGIEPYSYLKDVLTRLPSMKMSQVPSITPAAWAATRSQADQIAS
jgi:transposase